MGAVGDGAPPPPHGGGGDDDDGYVCHAVLGAGAFGAVLEAVTPSGMRCIAKRAHADAGVETLAREARVLAALPEHPHVVRFLHYQTSGGATLLYLGYAGGRNLLTQAERWRVGLEPVHTTLEALVPQMAGALMHVHAHGVYHRDVKLETFVVTERPAVRGGLALTLVDFGVASAAGETTAAPPLTPAYAPHVAPECFLLGGERTASAAKLDAWSFGVALHSLLFFALPFAHAAPPRPPRPPPAATSAMAPAPATSPPPPPPPPRAPVPIFPVGVAFADVRARQLRGETDTVAFLRGRHGCKVSSLAARSDEWFVEACEAAVDALLRVDPRQRLSVTEACRAHGLHGPTLYRIPFT